MVVPVLEKLIADVNKRNFRDTLVKDCAITFYDPIFLRSLNTKTHLVACKNGVYDLTAAEFRSGKPSDYLTFTTHRNFVTGMLSPHESISRPYLTIMRECAAFIKDVLVEDAVIDMMLAALCMSMHGETTLHKFFLWVGCGSNGKSKLANLFRAALGDYSITIPVTVFTQKRIEYGRACPELQRTKGRRVVFISEPSHNETLNLGIVKEVTGGDAMYTRGLYEDGGEMQYVFLFKSGPGHLSPRQGCIFYTVFSVYPFFGTRHIFCLSWPAVCRPCLYTLRIVYTGSS
jgi:phage/plasmid-associated DNA primase